jgi:hypothetical protein
LLQVADDTVLAVPRQWTDLVAPDPEIVIGGGRALFRVRDLLELLELVDHLDVARPNSLETPNDL